MPQPPELEIEVFNVALELPVQERAAYLDQACAGDPALRQRIEGLLKASEQSCPCLEGPAAVSPGPGGTVRLASVPAEKPGDRIGRYKLLQQLGEGGCGVVYMAEQEEPVRRRVALKVIKLGMDTKQVIARFEAERQALALMDHPNIAKVLEAGATDTGRPYFVMELVRGIKITDYCDQNNLSTQERLDLFIQVCHAIQHAHQKGVIHRDIKPSNILVTVNDGIPVPKVIDFGIAKATAGRLTDQTVFTAFEQFIGTPAYMSPEQAVMTSLDIDTRSDIYSLGVLLYELLTGHTPFDAKKLLQAGLDEIRRTIREQEPPRPSTCLSTMLEGELTTTARQRQTEPLKLIHLVRGDLDWIVMKALEKNRTRRYDTANGLAMDITRHLNCEPVLACPPSRFYEFQKTVRRHKFGFGAAALIGVVLVAATGISAWQAVRASRAETAARERLAESEAISKFLIEVFQSPDPARDGRTITVAETLGAAARKLETDLASQPARRAKLQATLGSTYSALGLYSEAVPLQEKARDYDLAVYGLENTNTLSAMNNLATSYDSLGRFDEALKLREQVLSLCRKVNGPEHPDTLKAMNNLAISLSYDSFGRQAEALKLREEMLPLFRKVLGPEHPNTLMAMNNLALSYDSLGRQAEALKLREQVLSLSRKVNGPEHPDTLTAMSNLADSYDEAGRLDEALKLREETLPLFRKVLGPEHPYTLMAMKNLADSYYSLGRQAEALKLREQVLPLYRKVLGPANPNTLWAINNLATSYDSLGRQAEGLKLREESLTLCRKVLGPEHPNTLWAMNNLADAYYALGRDQEAIALLQQCCKLNPTDTLASLKLATWQAWFGQDAAYEATRRRLIQQAEGTDRTDTADQAAKAACIRLSTDADLLAKTLNVARNGVELGKTKPVMPWNQLSLGMAEYRNGQYAAAEHSLTIAEQTAGDGHAIAVDDQHALQGIARFFRAMSLFHEGKLEEARKLFIQAEAQMPPLPKDESKPLVNGKPASHDDLIWWLAYKEAKALIKASSAPVAEPTGPK
jgi:serine/threonine protein kinase/tetratricopeptide (TPR) repeat protein